MKLISATPSPYARKVRIALAEKGVPFELQTEVPWDSTTRTPEYNPLEKLPVLILGDGNAVYESHFILEWLEAKYPPPHYYGIYPKSQDDLLFAKQVEVVSDGMCDACVMVFFEKQREQPSKEWTARQMRKIEGGLKQLNEWIGDKEFLLENRLTLADIAAGSVLGYMTVRFQAIPWREQYPKLAKYVDRLEERESFRHTKPYPQKISDKIV